MKKAIALMLAVCCIFGVLVMGVSAAKADQVTAQARYNPQYYVCTDTVLFRDRPSTGDDSVILGQFEPGEHMIVMDWDSPGWLHGTAHPDSALYREWHDTHPEYLTGYSVEYCFQLDRNG